MKKGMFFGLSHREKRVKKMILLHFLVSTLKNFLILELPEPSTDYKSFHKSFFGILNRLDIDKKELQNQRFVVW